MQQIHRKVRSPTCPFKLQWGLMFKARRAYYSLSIIGYPVSALLQVSGHTSVEISLGFLSLGFLKCPRTWISSSRPPKVHWVCPERRAGHCPMNPGGEVQAHVKLAVLLFMFLLRGHFTRWCLKRTLRPPGVSCFLKVEHSNVREPQPTIVIQFWLQLLIIQKNFWEMNDFKEAKWCFALAAIWVHQSTFELRLFRRAALQSEFRLWVTEIVNDGDM